jgi:UDP:flavonoid glycosyltransferase YjiC (YdhE family)
MGFANEAQKNKFGTAPFHCVGSLIDPLSTKRAPIEDFPMATITSARDSGKKLVLMSLGTATTGMFFSRPLPRGDNGLIEACSTGKDLAHFVWKTAFDALGGSSDILVIMAIGNQPDALDGLGNMPNNFLPVAVVPQLEVLPLCSAFITHGGMGSVMESIVYSVPMVVIPAFGDQIDTADSVQKSGMGFGFRYPLKTLDVESLSKAVAELLDPTPANRYRAAVKSSKKKMETTGGATKSIEIIMSITKSAAGLEMPEQP